MNKVFKFNSFKFAKSDMPENDEMMMAGEVPSDIQIFKSGIFSYWEPNDMILGREAFQSMVNNFNLKSRGTDLAIDYGHECFEEAAGWITNLYINTIDDTNCELWATVKWTNEAKEKILDRQYRYVSGEFSYDYVNEKGVSCGPCLYGAALTNRPFLKEMQAVMNLSEKYSLSKSNGVENMDEIKKLNEQVKTLTVQLDELRKENSDLKAKEIEREKALAEEKKEKEFEALMLSGKAVAAQKEAFMTGDVLKFAELACPVSLNAKGTSEDPNAKTKKLDDELSSEEAADRVLELATKRIESDKIDLERAIQITLSENPKLAEKYNQLGSEVRQ